MKTNAKPIRVPRAQYSGAYTIHDASLYLRATTPPRPPVRLDSRHPIAFVGPSSYQVTAWLREILDWPPAVEENGGRGRLLTFYELIRLKMYVLLRSRGVALRAIRQSEAYLRQLTGSPQPFVSEAIWSSSSDVFVKFSNRLLSATKRGQLAMDFLWEYVDAVKHELRFGEDEIAQAWSPRPLLLIDPEIGFGAPCVAGTRIQTEVLWSLVKAGNTVDELTQAYGIAREKVEAALAWEQALAEAA